MAYDEFIRGRSGADINVEKYGGWFSYNETARAKIFKRDAPKVANMGDMQRLMRSCECVFGFCGEILPCVFYSPFPFPIPCYDATMW